MSNVAKQTNKTRIKPVANKFYDICTFIIIFVSTVCVSLNVELFSDDFTYKQAGVCGFDQIVEFLKWHVTSYNGRTLIHFMEMMMLRYDFGFLIWKLFTGLLVYIFCFVSSRITVNDKSDYTKAILLSALCFFGINPCIWNESVFWVSGSFNYFIPTMMLIGLMFLVRRNPESKWIFPIGFICGATTEQVGMMTFGFFVILLLEHIVRARKVSVRYLVCCLISAAGYATVLFSPGTSSRVETQNEVTIKVLIENIITILQENWFGNTNLFTVIIPTTILISYFVLKHRKINNVLDKASVPAIVILWILTFFNIGIKGISVLNEGLGLNIAFPQKVNMIFFVLWLVYVFIYFAVFLLATVLIYKQKSDIMPFVFFILGFGSQIMMSVAGKSYFRTCLPMLFMIILFEVYSALILFKDIKNTGFVKKIKFLNGKKGMVIAISLLICICAVFVVFAIPNLYNTEEHKVGIEIVALSSEELKEFTDDLDEAYIKYYSNPKSDWNRRKDIMDFSKY
ncbi:MAG: hypothetical protein IK955_08295 [Clostridia bacterium]|nr:hypothetical protein [Clostridia bacterium]